MYKCNIIIIYYYNTYYYYLCMYIIHFLVLEYCRISCEKCPSACWFTFSPVLILAIILSSLVLWKILLHNIFVLPVVDPGLNLGGGAKVQKLAKHSIKLRKTTVIGERVYCLYLNVPIFWRRYLTFFQFFFHKVIPNTPTTDLLFTI